MEKRLAVASATLLILACTDEPAVDHADGCCPCGHEAAYLADLLVVGNGAGERPPERAPGQTDAAWVEWWMKRDGYYLQRAAYRRQIGSWEGGDIRAEGTGEEPSPEGGYMFTRFDRARDAAALRLDKCLQENDDAIGLTFVPDPP